MRGKRIPNPIRDIIYRTYIIEDGYAAFRLCWRMGYSTRSYYNIIRTHGATNQHRNYDNDTIWTQDEFAFVENLLTQNPTLTLEEIIVICTLNNLPPVAVSTLFNYLHAKIGISRKALTRWGSTGTFLM